MAEQTFLEVTTTSNCTIKVTNARVIIGADTYQLTQINHVVMYKIPPKINWAIGLIVIGIICFFMSVNYMNSGLGLVGALMAVGGILAIIFLLKPCFSVRFTTSSGQVDALRSKDQAFIGKIVSAINEAIASKV